MTAREQARAAAVGGFATFPNTIEYRRLQFGADAASDVWEPLLREAVEHLAVWMPPNAAMVERIREALGDG